MNLRIMSPAQVERTLTRLAYEIVERNRGADNLVIFGIEKAGAGLATSLAGRLSKMESCTVEARGLDVSAFRDDLESGPDPGNVERWDDVDLTDRDIILVDDVLCSGRTVRAALDAVVRYGRPRSIQLLVLIDRGHREYPIQPDYVGKKIPTKSGENVVVEQDENVTVHIVE